jgi:sporulation protein YlmC with PRC-barrel domain
MRLSELIDREVVTEDGEGIGHVHDVRLVQDGPMLGVWGHAFRLDALIVGGGAMLRRMGLHRRKVHGPWLLRSALGLVHREAHVIPWTDVVEVGERIVVRSSTGS